MKKLVIATLLLNSFGPSLMAKAKTDAKAEAPKASTKEGPEPTQKCALEFEQDGKPIGTVVLDLYGKVAPKTVDNFMVFCAGEKATVLSKEAKAILAADKKSSKFKAPKYTNTVVHRIIPGFMIQAGDFEKENGTGGFSIYGGTFPDENFTLNHMGAGTLSMANAGPGTNGSQFFITVAPTSWLDGKHVVFGKVSDGMDVLKKVEALGSESGKTKSVVKISKSSEVKL